MTKSVSGIFKTSTQARDVLLRLEQAGFSESKISVVSADQSIGKSFTMEKDSKATEGAGIGAAAGGLLGAIAGGLLAAGTLVIPGLNVVAVGSIVAALAGAGAGATVGGLAGALIGLGIPEYEAKRYEKAVKEGAVLIVVDVENSNEEKQVKNLFEQFSDNKIAA